MLIGSGGHTDMFRGPTQGVEDRIQTESKNLEYVPGVP